MSFQNNVPKRRPKTASQNIIPNVMKTCFLSSFFLSLDTTVLQLLTFKWELWKTGDLLLSEKLPYLLILKTLLPKQSNG